MARLRSFSRLLTVLTVASFTAAAAPALDPVPDLAQSEVARITVEIQAHPKDGKKYVQRAARYLGLHEWQKAIDDYSKALSLGSKDSDIYSYRGFSYFQLGQWQKGIDDCTKSLSMHPNNPLMYANRARAYKRIGRMDLAQKDLDALKDLTDEVHGKKNESLFRRAAKHEQEKEYAEAIADYNQILKQSKRDGTAYRLRGDNYARLRKWDQAAADYTQALKYDSKQAPVILELRASVYDRMGRHDLAEKDRASGNQ